MKSLLLGLAKGKDVATKILETLEEYSLKLELFLNIGSDGPNVNKTVWNCLDQHLKEIGLSGLLTFSPCNIHVVHNAFKHAIQVYGQQAEQLAIDLFYWFKAHPCRKEDYFDTQLGLGFTEELFLRHVQCRWLTLIPALERIVKNWDPLLQYFQKDLPRLSRENGTEKTLKNNESYKRICNAISGNSILLQFHFSISVKQVFDRILGFMQRQEPLIHLLHDECLQLIKTLMQRFLKKKATEKSCRDLLKLDLKSEELQLPSRDMEIGETTRRMLAKLPSDQQKRPLMDMRAFLQNTTQYLLNHLPIGDTLLRDLGVLHPAAKEAEDGSRCIRRFARTLHQIVQPDEIPSIFDEWNIYQHQDIPEEWYCVAKDREGDVTEWCRIDDYWSKVLSMKTRSGEQMFPNLVKVVKGALCLSHGNADCERSLSINKRVLGTDRTLLSEESLNGIRLIKDAVSNAGGKVEEMPFKRQLLTSVRQAHDKYRSRLEEKKKQETAKLEEKRQEEEVDRARKATETQALEMKKRKQKDTERSLTNKHEELQAELKTAEDLFDEANTRLAEAVKEKNLSKLPVLQSLLDIALKKMSAARHNMEIWQKERKSLDAKRQKLLDESVAKKSS